MSSSGASSTPNAPSGKKTKGSSSGGNDAIKVICRFRPPRAPRKDAFPNKAKQAFTPDEFKLNLDSGDIQYLSDFQDSKQFKFDKVRLTDYHCLQGRNL